MSCSSQRSGPDEHKVGRKRPPSVSAGCDASHLSDSCGWQRPPRRAPVAARAWLPVGVRCDGMRPCSWQRPPRRAPVAARTWLPVGCEHVPQRHNAALNSATCTCCAGRMRLMVWYGMVWCPSYPLDRNRCDQVVAAGSGAS
jgi:hypothetical protein